VSGADPIAQLVNYLKTDRTPFLQEGHGELFIARAPGRLDVMGGIADYTGSLVCEIPLDVAAAVAVQRRDDRKLVIKTYNENVGGAEPFDPQMELSLDDFYGTAALLPNETLRGLFTAGAGKRWAALVAGVFPVLARHKNITRRTHGANIACFSNVPLGAGVSSSAALTCATLSALTAAYHLILEPLEIAVMAQKVENHIVGAPCGVMDPVTSMLGKKDHMLLLKCQPHELKGLMPVPRGYFFAGICSQVNHSVACGPYRHTRISAFIAHAIIARFFSDVGIKKDPTRGYLANVSADLFHRYFRLILPETISGRDFLAAYGPTIDRVTQVDAEEIYTPRAAAEHHILENHRVHQFVEHLRAMDGTADAGHAGSTAHAIAAGKLMLEAHASYSNNARLGSLETDLLVDLIMQRGPDRGFYGAKITGGGSGGTVALLAADTPETRAELQVIAGEYQHKMNITPEFFMTSAPGAAETAPRRVAISALA